MRGFYETAPARAPAAGPFDRARSGWPTAGPGPGHGPGGLGLGLGGLGILVWAVWVVWVAGVSGLRTSPSGVWVV